MFDLNDDDRRLAKKIYKLSDSEMVDAERMYYRSGTRSYLACCKSVANKRTQK